MATNWPRRGVPRPAPARRFVGLDLLQPVFFDWWLERYIPNVKQFPALRKFASPFYPPEASRLSMPRPRVTIGTGIISASRG